MLGGESRKIRSAKLRSVPTRIFTITRGHSREQYYAVRFVRNSNTISQTRGSINSLAQYQRTGLYIRDGNRVARTLLCALFMRALPRLVCIRKANPIRCFRENSIESL